MKRRRLGPVEVGAIGLGCMSMTPIYGEPSEPDPLDQLSEREREVLGYTAEGYSSSEIGEKLFISPKTVDTYRSRIMEKLKLNHRSELVRFALRTGLLKSE